jgi:TPR repeat protein
MKLAPKQLFFTIVLVLSGATVTLVINSTSPIAAVSNSTALRSDDSIKPAAAYGRRDFETVRALAEQGDDTAQYYLGRMYDEGTTVPESWEEKLKWYRLAADNGNDSAQYTLGVLYHTSSRSRDYVEAHKWLNLAAAQGNQSAATYRDTVAERTMSHAELLKAEKLAAEWWSSNKMRVAKAER